MGEILKAITQFLYSWYGSQGRDVVILEDESSDPKRVSFEVWAKNPDGTVKHYSVFIKQEEK